ncbi:MAG: hypothetical protein H7145_05785 [Akkermansiaceae bacterium]|nr:hypothetical protein [Armatimonadota bacterium]
MTRFFDADGTSGKAIAEPMDAVPFERKSSEFLDSPARVLEKGWDFRRVGGDNTPLFAPGGVYIVDVRTPDGVSIDGVTINEALQRQLFIAPGAARGSTDNDANGVSVETKDLERENGIGVLHVNASGLTSLPRTKDILLSFTPGFGTPPKNWEVFLRRYKEARDGRPYSETAQPITVEEATPTSWRLRRQGNDPLDPYAVYVIEIRRTGSGKGIRHLFITGGE